MAVGRFSGSVAVQSLMSSHMSCNDWRATDHRTAAPASPSLAMREVDLDLLLLLLLLLLCSTCKLVWWQGCSGSCNDTCGSANGELHTSGQSSGTIGWAVWPRVTGMMPVTISSSTTPKLHASKALLSKSFDAHQLL